MKIYRWVFAFCAVTLGMPAYAMNLYSVIDLGPTPAHYGYIGLESITDNGQVLGGGGTVFGDRAWVWNQKDGFRELENLDYSGPIDTYAADNNNSGQVVGWGFTRVPEGSGQVPHAFLYDPRHGMQDISVLAGNPEQFSFGTGINSNGTVVGWGSFGEVTRGFVWRKNRPMRTLGNLSDDLNRTRPSAISDRGDVVGWSSTATAARSRAFLWTERRGMVDLGDLPGGRDWSSADDVNERGQVVGSSFATNGRRGFVWSVDTGMVDLGTLRGGQDYSNAVAINNRGTIVGTSSSNDGWEPVVWFDGRTIYRLNDLIHPKDSSYGVNLGSAIDINERGQILVGSPQRLRLGYILTPWKSGVVRRADRPSKPE